MTTTIRVTDGRSREACAKLVHLGKRASREFPVVGTPDAPTRWDLRHREINDLLDELTAEA